MIRLQNTLFFEDKDDYLQYKSKEDKALLKELGWFHEQHHAFKEYYSKILHNPKDYWVVLRKVIKPVVDNWFVSDLHLGQERILQYDKRPFKSIQEHDLSLLNNINSVVKPNDNLYVLGDTFFYKKKNWDLAHNWLLQLKGHKFFIKGNHDYKETVQLYQKHGTYLGEQRMIKIGEDRIVLNHFPMRSWLNSHHGTYHLYGHHHGDIDHKPHGRSMDVWIGTKNYTPLNWIVDIKPVLLNRNIFLLEGDHHKIDSL